MLLQIHRSKTKILGRWQHSELFGNENAAGLTMPNMGYNQSRIYRETDSIQYPYCKTKTKLRAGGEI